MARCLHSVHMCSVAVLLCSISISLLCWLYLPAVPKINNFHSHIQADSNKQTDRQTDTERLTDTDRQTDTDYHCTATDETAICTLRNVCYHPPNGKSTFRHEFSLGANNSLPVGPVAYLTAPDIFPQSGVYLKHLAHLPPPHYEQEDSFLFIRFKPDNLMHVIHDDVLPVYSTLSRVYNTLEYPYRVRILFADDFGEMPHDYLLQKLTSFHLSYAKWKRSRCFRKLAVGFDKSSLWYQYGFDKLQGPLPHNQTYILTLLQSLFPAPGSVSENSASLDSAPRNSALRGSQIVLFSRGETRRILNEAELSSALARVFTTRVVLVDLDTHLLSDIAEEVSRARLVIGMHGALFSSIVWLPPHALVVELFPYAVPPDHYKPYKTLAEIKGLRYICWGNTHIEHTVGHPDYPKHYGGLMHLTESQRDLIISEREVVPHKCCDDHSWLYHIYQDTVVHVNEIIQLLPARLH